MDQRNKVLVELFLTDLRTLPCSDALPIIVGGASKFSNLFFTRANPKTQSESCVVNYNLIKTIDTGHTDVVTSVAMDADIIVSGR